MCYRGESFRYDFLQLGEIRSIIPSTTHILALTATATKAVFQAAVTTLHMRSSEVIAAAPESPNIFLCVVAKKELIEVVQDMVILGLSSEGDNPCTRFIKTLVFCRKKVI